MDNVRLDVIEQTLIVCDDNGRSQRLQFVDTFGNDSQRIDVQVGIQSRQE